MPEMPGPVKAGGERWDVSGVLFRGGHHKEGKKGIRVGRASQGQRSVCTGDAFHRSMIMSSNLSRQGKTKLFARNVQTTPKPHTKI